MNLKYIKTQLTSHGERLAETIGLLENRHSLDWPRVPTSDAAEKTAALLLTDFKYLLHRADSLARECEQGMATLANSSMLDESRRSVDNAIRVERLTVLATIFIPLSFVCSIWGMNFQEMGSGSLHFWMWFATAGPIVAFSLAVYHFDFVRKLFCRFIVNSSKK